MKQKEFISTTILAIILLGMSYYISIFQDWNKKREEKNELERSIEVSIEIIKKDKNKILELEKEIGLDKNDRGNSSRKLYIQYYNNEIKYECLSIQNIEMEKSHQINYEDENIREFLLKSCIKK
jgi:type II secretory pathway pseudopilin PulG